MNAPKLCMVVIPTGPCLRRLTDDLCVEHGEQAEPTLGDLRAASWAAWKRHSGLHDFTKQALAVDSVYVPALEAEIRRLHGETCICAICAGEQ